MSNQEERARLLQLEWREEVIPNLGGEPWIRVYESGLTGPPEEVGFFCGLIPNANAHASIRTHEWDMYIGYGLPGFMRTFDEDGESETVYDRYGHLDHGIEPLIFVRSFGGLRSETIEISEEFRFFHNLYFEASESAFFTLDASGDAVPVVRMSDSSVDIRRKHLRQFLGIKDMSLVLYFDRICFSQKSLELLSILEDDAEFSSDSFRYQFSVYDAAFTWPGIQSQSRILGKAIIKGLPFYRSGGWPLDEYEQKLYEEFIMDVDDDDEPITYTSNPDELADYFGKNKHAPHYLTSVFFLRQVLAKYYNEPEKYRIEDGLLWCGNQWTLRMDNNHANYVVVFLGDLGRYLPYKEQLHWKRYNIIPDGTMSETYFRRSFLNQWAEASDSALRFQGAFRTFSKSWLARFGWHLFKPLAGTDTHHYTKLRRPLTNELTEFHEIVLSLSILLQDSINIKELRKRIPDFDSKDSDGKDKRNILVLGELLESEGLRGAAQYVEYLRMLQLLRSNSGTVHRRNEKEYQKATTFFSLDTKSTVQVADDIFTTLTEFLNSLREHFCPDEEH